LPRFSGGVTHFPMSTRAVLGAGGQRG